jgi:hypothetical protein
MAQEIRQGDLVAFVSDTETGECGECYRNMVYGNVTRVWQRRNPHVPLTLTIVTGDGKTYVRYAERCTLVMDVKAGACEPVEPTCDPGLDASAHGPTCICDDCAGDNRVTLDANHGPNCGCGYHTLLNKESAYLLGDDMDTPPPVEPVSEWTDWKTCGNMRDVTAGVYVGPSAPVRPF